MFGTLKKYSNPMETAGDHPELDESKVMNDDCHPKYQMIMRFLVWVVTIGWIGTVAHAMSSLSRFMVCPRQGHQDRAILRVFGYLKKRPNHRRVVHSRDPIYRGGKDVMDLDFTKESADKYPDAFEEIDVNLP
jgi:hypothetical protein